MNYTTRQLGDLTPSNPNRRQGLLAVFHIDLPLLVGLLLLGLGTHGLGQRRGQTQVGRRLPHENPRCRLSDQQHVGL